MKRVVPLLCLILSALVFLGGCGGTAAKPPDNTVAKPPSKSGPWAELTPPLSGDLEKPDWPVVSIVPEDYGIVYEPESLSELAGYPLDKLIAYYLATIWARMGRTRKVPLTSCTGGFSMRRTPF